MSKMGTDGRTNGKLNSRSRISYENGTEMINKQKLVVSYCSMFKLSHLSYWHIFRKSKVQLVVNGCVFFSIDKRVY